MSTISLINLDGVLIKNKLIFRVVIPGPLKNNKGQLIEFKTQNNAAYRKQLSYIVKYV